MSGPHRNNLVYNERNENNNHDDHSYAAQSLLVYKCACGYGTLLDRPYCPKCHDLLHESRTDAPLCGVVLSWTKIHEGGEQTPDPAPGVEVSVLSECPIGLAMIGLDSGINAMAKFDPTIMLQVGDHVSVEVRADGLRWATMRSVIATEKRAIKK